MVMPSWAAESWKDSSRKDLRTVRAARSPACACVSMAARSTVTSENSAVTKNALMAVSSTNASSGSVVIRMSMVGSPRAPFCPKRSRRSGQGQHDHGLVVEAVDAPDAGDLTIGVEAGEGGTGGGLLQPADLAVDPLIAQDGTQRRAAERQQPDRRE